MQRLQEINLHLNIKKCEFRVQSIFFVGNVFTSKGLQVDLEKLQAIRDRQTPTSKTKVRRFLGMTKYMSRYISHRTRSKRTKVGTD